jgi:hypothetical protein
LQKRADALGPGRFVMLGAVYTFIVEILIPSPAFAK